MGDTAWSLFTNLTLAQANEYFDDLASRGFNACNANVIEHLFTTGTAPRDTSGNLPFAGTAFQSSLTPAYWDAVDLKIAAARARGILIYASICYMGYPTTNEGWEAEANAASNAQMTSYGAAVGARFAAHPNIAYTWVNDQNPDSNPTYGTTIRSRVDACQAGVASTDAGRLHSLHLDRGVGRPSNSWEAPSSPDWSNYHLAYPYQGEFSNGYVHTAIKEGWSASAKPIILFEAGYENNPNTGSSEELRRIHWGARLFGATAALYGNAQIWGFGNGLFFDGFDWRDHKNDTGRVQIGYLRSFFVARRWWLLTPDFAEAFVTGGRGTLDTVAYVTAALASDGSWGAAYVPGTSVRSSADITVDKSKFSGAFNWTWFNPRTGGTSGGANGVVASGSSAFTPPDGNDWVWVGDVP
jgi:hypothetical protein